MTTMKQGPGDDPFDEDEEEQDATEDLEDNPNPETEDEMSKSETAADRTESNEEPDEDSSVEMEYPYVLRRQTVKEDRDNRHVAVLRDEYADLEDEIHEKVADEMGLKQKDVSLFDVREGMLEVADEHTDELAEVLLEWGYEHRTE